MMNKLRLSGSIFLYLIQNVTKLFSDDVRAFPISIQLQAYMVPSVCVKVPHIILCEVFVSIIEPFHTVTANLYVFACDVVHVNELFL